MSSDQTDSWIGSTIDGRYTIEDRIARGGMSTVYVARDERLGRRVALKVLFPHMAEDRKVVNRFEQEARNSALISHPNVVQVLDQGQTRETAYLVMEHVPGFTLRTVLKRGPMTPRLALTYMEAILQGLAAAHRAGIVHRDIKPENVLVSRDGRIKLADFGLARAATHHSGTSTLMGTVAYISPELLSGEGADERADVYAMGILFYEMLTGVQPYTGDSPVRVAFQHVNSTVPAPSAHIPGLAPALDEVVRAATQSDTSQRLGNADELLTAVKECREQLTAEELDFDSGRAQGHPGASAGAAGIAGAGGAAAALSGKEAPSDGEGTQQANATSMLPATEALSAEDAATVAGDSEDSEDSSAESLSSNDEHGEEFADDDSGGDAETGSDADAGDPDATVPVAEGWDSDVDAALNHARSAYGAQALDEEDRLTVQEVPTEAFRSEDIPHAPGPAEQTQAISYTAASPDYSGQEYASDQPYGQEETSEFSAIGQPRQSSQAPAEQAPRTPKYRDPRKAAQQPQVELNVPNPTRIWLTIAIVMIVSAVLTLLGWSLGLSPGIIPSLGSGQ